MVTLAAAVVLAGCGGGESAKTSFEDVRPCLNRLALVAANKFTGTLTTPTGQVTTLAPPPDTDVVDWSVDLAYRSAPRGANAAHLAFFKSDDAATRERKRARETARTTRVALNDNFRRMLAKAEVVGGSVVVTWSSDPTAKQKRHLAACFD